MMMNTEKKTVRSARGQTVEGGVQDVNTEQVRRRTELFSLHVVEVEVQL